MNVKFSCIIDLDPKFATQALVWAASLLTYGGQQPDSLVVHTIDESPGRFQEILNCWMVQTRILPRFDARHPSSNKLAQLESEALQSADYVVLCNCDIAFCGDISPLIAGDAIRGRTASFAGLTIARWQKIFQLAGLPLPHSRRRALLTGKETLPTYCNGRLYIIPQGLFQKLRYTWPHWHRWLLDRSDELRRFMSFADQISFAMSCEALRLTINPLPLELNFGYLLGPDAVK
jgi:hypothetical protein